jgi:hypothetical protein
MTRKGIDRLRVLENFDRKFFKQSLSSGIIIGVPLKY